jgi:hypothetical protein
MMIYKLLHNLFGWDYVYWQNSCDYGVARIYKDGEGNPFYWQYKTTSLAKKINSPSDVMWLTCKSDKYKPVVYENKIKAEGIEELLKKVPHFSNGAIYIDDINQHVAKPRESKS